MVQITFFLSLPNAVLSKCELPLTFIRGLCKLYCDEANRDADFKKLNYF